MCIYVYYYCYYYSLQPRAARKTSRAHTHTHTPPGLEHLVYYAMFFPLSLKWYNTSSSIYPDVYNGVVVVDVRVVITWSLS